MTPGEIEARLEDMDARDEGENQTIRDEISRLKREAVARGDQPAAKHLWCLETALDIQTKYLTAFSQMRAGEHYNAWCTLELVELGLGRLQKHFPCDRFHLEFIRSAT